MPLPKAKLPIEAVREAGRNPRIIQAVARYYQQADAELLACTGLCKQCGRCCRFATCDHRLFVTSIELCYLAARVGPELPSVSDWPAECPYQDRNRCSIHPYRMLGCRLFACKPPADLEARQIAEALHRQLARLHETWDVPYCYVEWGEALRQFYDAGASGD